MIFLVISTYLSTKLPLIILKFPLTLLLRVMLLSLSSTRIMSLKQEVASRKLSVNLNKETFIRKLLRLKSNEQNKGWFRKWLRLWNDGEIFIFKKEDKKRLVCRRRRKLSVCPKKVWMIIIISWDWVKNMVSILKNISMIGLDVWETFWKIKNQSLNLNTAKKGLKTLKLSNNLRTWRWILKRWKSRRSKYLRNFNTEKTKSRRWCSKRMGKVSKWNSRISFTRTLGFWTHSRILLSVWTGISRKKKTRTFSTNNYFFDNIFVYFSSLKLNTQKIILILFMIFIQFQKT